MRYRSAVALSVIALVAGVLGPVPAGAQATPDEKDRSTRIVVRVPGTLPRDTHVDPSALIGPRRRALRENFDVLAHVRMPGRQAAADIDFFDHGARGKFVYIGSFRSPCSTDGVRIIDVSPPRRAQLASVARLPSRWRTSVEDVVVEQIGNRVVLAGGLQACGRNGRDGMALWDVTRPRHPERLAFLRTPAGVHELDLAVRADDTVLALLVTPFTEWTDTYFETNFGGEFRIVDVTHPRNPDRLSNWGIIRDSDLVTFGGDEIVSSFQGMDTFFTAIYAHSVRDADDGMTAYVSYWDAGILKLDISDPENPALLGRTFYEVGDAGDGHSMFPLDVGGTRYVIQNDEDYDPDSPVSVTSSETGATAYNGMHEFWMPRDLYDTGAITGEVWDAGDGCQSGDYAGADGMVALADTVDPFYEGIIPGWSVPCSLHQQVRRAANHGATALLSNLISPDDPFPFPFFPPNGVADDEDMVVVQVADADGLAAALRGAVVTSSVTLTPNTPAVGYVRIFDESQLTDLDGDGNAEEFTEVATFTEPDHVLGDLTVPRRGTWSVHNTEVNGNIAYSSWYSHGIVAWDLSTITAPAQVGQFRPRTRRAAWPLVWGVAIDPETGLVFASDMVGGLWIARPTGPAVPT